jgi:hypothetical protein
VSLGAIGALAARSRALVRANGARPAHYSATTVAVTAEVTRRIADRIERFRHEIGELLESNEGDRDQVYCLELAFFPVANLPTMEL